MYEETVLNVFKKDLGKIQQLKKLDDNPKAKYKDYYDILKEFNVYPQRQNLLHYFAFKNRGDLLTDALDDGKIPYHRDFQGKTPLKISIEN